MPELEGQIEAEFLHPVYLGESILPFKAWKPVLGVIPVSGKGDVLNSEMATRGYLHLHEWMHRAEALWNKHGPGSMKFTEQLDYYGKLASQFSIPKLRVVYAKAGTLPAAAIIEDDRAVIDHMLYWMAIQERHEGLYLACILGSEAARKRTENLQAKGHLCIRLRVPIMNDTTLKQIAAVKATVNKGNHIWT